METDDFLVLHPNDSDHPDSGKLFSIEKGETVSGVRTEIFKGISKAKLREVAL
jgi:hypothetical protein